MLGLETGTAVAVGEGVGVIINVGWSVGVAVAAGVGLGVVVAESDGTVPIGMGVVPSPPQATKVPSRMTKPKNAAQVHHLPNTIPVISSF